jgi:type IV pilus assembly protein PilM
LVAFILHELKVIMPKLFKRNQTVAMIGVDFGSSAVKVLALSKRADNYIVDMVSEVATPKGCVVDHQLQDIEALTNVFQQVRQDFPGRYKQAASAVSGTNVITKIIYVDADLSGPELEMHIELEAENLIPFPLDEISLDFEIMGVNENDAGKHNVLLSATRTESVAALAGCLEENNFVPQIVDVAAHALARAHELYLRLEDLQDDDKVIAAIDIGADMTIFSMLHKGESIYSRVQNFGGENYTRAISEHYSLKRDEAENLKLSQQLPLDYDIDVLAPYITACMQQVRRNLQLFSHSGALQKVDMITLSGGSALIEELAQQIESELGIPTRVANPFAKLSYADGVEDRDRLVTNGPRYMVALGLAMRAL